MVPQNAPTRPESRIALQYACPICLNRPAVCSVSLRVSMGIQNRVQLFTLTQPHCTQYLSDLCGLAAWTTYNTSFWTIQQHGFAILIHTTSETNLCWYLHKVHWPRAARFIVYWIGSVLCWTFKVKDSYFRSISKSDFKTLKVTYTDAAVWVSSIYRRSI